MDKLLVKVLLTWCISLIWHTSRIQCVHLTASEQSIITGLTGSGTNSVELLHDVNALRAQSAHMGLPNFKPTPTGMELGVHLDLPREHGHLPNAGIPVNVMSANEHLHGAGSSVHVDRPGEHGNMSPHPVVHRGGPGHGGGIHVDMPGEHGNPLTGGPVVHREGFQGSGTGQGFVDTHGTHGGHAGHGGGGGSIHVDLPGEHGNMSPHPVVHRQDGPGHGHGGGAGVHVDMPGQHGNPITGIPVIHREGVVDGHGHGHGPGVHIDLPLQHGNPSATHAVVHRQDGFIDTSSGFPEAHKHHLGMEPNMTLPLVHGHENHMDIGHQQPGLMPLPMRAGLAPRMMPGAPGPGRGFPMMGGLPDRPTFTPAGDLEVGMFPIFDMRPRIRRIRIGAPMRGMAAGRPGPPFGRGFRRPFMRPGFGMGGAGGFRRRGGPGMHRRMRMMMRGGEGGPGFGPFSRGRGRMPMGGALSSVVRNLLGRLFREM